jgi:type I restriction enzyme M protein
MAEWRADESNSGTRFPSYARLLPQRGTPKGESHYSWTVDFAARRAKASEEMQPLRDGTAKIKAEVVDLKERLKRLRKNKASEKVLSALEAQIREKDKAARELESQAAALDAQGRIVAEALGRLKDLLAADSLRAEK